MKCSECGCEIEAVRAGHHVYCDHLCCGPFGAALGSADDHLARAAIHQRFGRLREAIGEAKQAVYADPKLGRAHSSLALLAMDAREYDLAWMAAREAERLGHPKAGPLIERLRKAAPEPKS